MASGNPEAVRTIRMTGSEFAVTQVPVLIQNRNIQDMNIQIKTTGV